MIKSTLDNSKILILGSKGFIGGAFKMASQFIGSNFYEEKINTKEKLHYLCNLKKIQMIINCAAKGVYPDASCSKEEIFLTNTTLVEWILEWLRGNHERKYVHFGSWFEDRVELQGNYVHSKRMATGIISAQSDSVRKQILHIQLYHVYGYHEKSTRLIPSIINSIRESSKFNISNPRQLLWLLWNGDIPSFVYSKLLINRYDQAIIHLKGDGPYSVQNVYERVLKIYSDPILGKRKFFNQSDRCGITKIEEGFRRLLFMPLGGEHETQCVY